MKKIDIVEGLSWLKGPRIVLLLLIVCSSGMFDHAVCISNGWDKSHPELSALFGAITMIVVGILAIFFYQIEDRQECERRQREEERRQRREEIFKVMLGASKESLREAVLTLSNAGIHWEETSVSSAGRVHVSFRLPEEIWEIEDQALIANVLVTLLNGFSAFRSYPSVKSDAREGLVNLLVERARICPKQALAVALSLGHLGLKDLF